MTWRKGPKDPYLHVRSHLLDFCPLFMYTSNVFIQIFLHPNFRGHKEHSNCFFFSFLANFDVHLKWWSNVTFECLRQLPSNRPSFFFLFLRIQMLARKRFCTPQRNRTDRFWNAIHLSFFQFTVNQIDCHWFCYKIRHILQLWFPTELSKLSSSCGFSVKITDPRLMSLFAAQPRPFPSIFFTLLFGSVPTLK